MDVDEAIEQSRWIATDYLSPHEYIVAHSNRQAFGVIAEAITKGPKITGVFQGRKYYYWYHNGYKYWWMGIIINRVRIPDIAA